MRYTSLETPLTVFVGEGAIGNVLELAKYQCPALFNYASEAFFLSDWFLKKMDGQPYQPRLIVPIRTSAALLEKAASDPHFLAYPLPDLPLSQSDSKDPAQPSPPAIPICAQLETLHIGLPSAAAAELPEDWALDDGHIFVRLRILLGMFAQTPGLPAIPNQPVLLLSFPIDTQLILSAGLVRGDDGSSRLAAALSAFDLLALQPLGLKEMLITVVQKAAHFLLPNLLAQIACPIEIKLPEISTFPTPAGSAPYAIQFPHPLRVLLRADARSAAQPNPEIKEDRFGLYLQLELA